ncbi:MAG: acetylglutamate kinase [Balneolaceae bacterium]
MSLTIKNKSVDDLLKTISFDHDSIELLKGKIVLIKIGGNALTDEVIKKQIISQVAVLHHFGILPVIIHGGGIEIKQLLTVVGLQSEFIGGHRKTDSEAITYIEMALSGSVNKEIVRLLLEAGVPAVGISGKDAALVTAQRRVHSESIKGVVTDFDLGFVGDVSSVNTGIVHTLLDGGYIPVISPISIGSDGKTYNINADMFAGHLAGALNAEKFVALTNIDGLLMNVNDPESLIESLTPERSKSLYGSVIVGGMIPKIDACLIALENGVDSVHIINGTKKENLLRILLTKDKIGTILRKN